MKKKITLFVFFITFNFGFSQIVINEVLYDPESGISGDTSGDGEYSQDGDSFVEIYNSSSSSIDISGYELWDDVVAGSVQLIFPPNTVILSKVAVVAFVDEPVGDFGESQVFSLVGNSGFNFNNNGEIIALF